MTFHVRSTPAATLRSTGRLRRRAATLVLMSLLLSVLPMGALPVASADDAPWIVSDLDDYPPGGLVTLTGGDWLPGENVRIVVDDDQDFTWRRDVVVVADGDGAIFDQFNLPNWFVATYTVVATGELSGTAVTNFTDSNPQAISVAAPVSATVTQGGTAAFGALTLQAAGNTRPCETELSVVDGGGSGLPSGATPQWGTNPLTTTGDDVTTSFSVATTPSTPTGTYTFRVAGTNSAPTDGQCQGTGPSDSNLVALTVTTGTVATTTTVDSDANPSTYGNEVTFTANVTASGGTPDSVGDVTFRNGSDVLCANEPLSGNTATCSTSTLTATGSPHGITAEYSGTTSGSPHFVGSTSVPMSQTVNQREVTGSFTADNKVYDGSTSATIATRSLAGAVPGDDVALDGGSVSFANKNAANDKTVTGTDFALAGDDALNYTLDSSTLTTTADITPRSLTVTAAAGDKVYDGTDAATVTLDTNALSGDDVTTDHDSAVFEQTGVGTDLEVTVSGISIDGGDADNYALQNTEATASANITSKEVTGQFTVDEKVYDGNEGATIATSSLVGDVLDDDVSLVGGTASFDNKNVGTGKTVTGTGFVLAGDDAHNYSLASSTLTTTADITARDLVVTATGVDKVYDGTDEATVNLDDDRVEDDVLVVSYSSASFVDKHVGDDKPVAVSGLSISGGDAGNYNLVDATDGTTASIFQRVITVTAVTDTKEYDGDTSSTGVPQVTSGSLADGDTAAFTQTFDDRNAGDGKTLTPAGVVLDGNAGDNYDVTFVQVHTGEITPLAITGSFTADNKVYDGTTDATVSDRSLDGVLGDDEVELSGGDASFEDKHVADGKTVTLSDASLSGAHADNYTLFEVEDAQADITALAITGSFTAEDKVYDGTIDATVIDRFVHGAVDGDDVSLVGGTATFADANVDTDKIVTLSDAVLDGDDAGNYSLTSVATTTADIAALAITGGFTADDKEYDGTTDADVLSYSVFGQVAGDDVSLSGGMATFDNKNVGTDKVVTLSGAALAGGDAGNYSLTSVATTTADITARDLVVTASGVDRVYDGTTSASVNLDDDRVENDDLLVSYSAASFGDAHVGDDKPVTVSGLSVSGDDVDNYNLVDATDGATASIFQRAITVTAVADTKVYDGDTSSDGVPQVTSGTLADGDTATWTQTFDDRNAGGGKTLTPDGVVVDGNDGDNYDVTFVAVHSGEITPLAITGSFTADDKVYDGTTVADVLTRSLNGALPGDNVTLSGGTASFDDKNVGDGKTVTLSGVALAGGDASNYSLTSVATTTADVTARNLTVTATGVNKVYDGTTIATVNLSTDKVDGDDVTAASTAASFNDRDVANGKPVSVSGISISGDDAGNYDLTNTDAGTTANITPRQVSGSFTAADKVYDGTTAATITDRSLSNTIAGDDVSLTGGTANFDDASVDTDKTVTGTGFSITGSDADNYTLASSTLTTTASIQAWDADGHGFFQPVGASNSIFVTAPDPAPSAGAGTVWNVAKGGSTIPLKFQVFADGVEKTSTADISAFTQTKLGSCGVGAAGEVDETLLTTGNTSLRYTGGQWIQNWKTPSVKKGAEECWRATVRFSDGSTLSAFFKLR